MEYKTVWTNYFCDSVAKEVDELLSQGYAVRVGASCIGHTRAQMVESGAKRYFEKCGCKKVEIVDRWGCTETYWTL